MTRVDARGKRCPLPVIDLAKHIADVDVGATLVVLADDPAAAPDIAAWCRMRGHELVESREEDGALAFEVRRLH